MFEAAHRTRIEEAVALTEEMLPSQAEELEQVRAEYREGPTRLETWRKAEKPSQDWRKAVFFEEALKILDTALFE